MYRIFLDDEREPPINTATNYGWIVKRNFKDITEHILAFGMPSLISFDHDLGENEKTGFDVAKWLVENDMYGNIIIPSAFGFYVHSQNPVGKENIEKYLNQYFKQKRGE